jgi:3-oxoacyl-[acyl-carrier protein] reductase
MGSLEPSNGRLKGRVALITGAGRGIGRATAELFAREGASVVIATRTESHGQATLEAIQAIGGNARLHIADLRSRAAARQAINATVEQFGRLHIVVHNAATMPFGMVWDTSDAALDDTIDVNLKTAFWMAAEALPALEKSKPASILVVSSITGNRQCQPGFSVYGASKAGLNAFVRMAAVELGSKGVRVNGVEPGLTLTDAARNLPAEEIRKIERFIPLGGMGQPVDIARALLFLASDEASHITGQVITVDGGQHLAPPC